MYPSFPTFFLKVDRSRALVRALWRLLCAVVVGGLLFQIRPDWALLWKTQPASCLALGLLTVCLAVVAFTLLVAAVRWLLLAVWPGPLGVNATAHGLELDLGPLGRRAYAWEEIVVDVEQEIEPGLIDELPDDSLAVRIRRRGTKENLARLIQLAANLSDEELTRRFRPLLGDGLRQPPL
ncbi:MAG TPA: hypothetical protein VJZ71_02595 [Phycisphaerae bacterium]|nr:hypothetical protein [Phycisphaerae bacterium]